MSRMNLPAQISAFFDDLWIEWASATVPCWKYAHGSAYRSVEHPFNIYSLYPQRVHNWTSLGKRAEIIKLVYGLIQLRPAMLHCAVQAEENNGFQIEDLLRQYPNLFDCVGNFQQDEYLIVTDPQAVWTTTVLPRPLGDASITFPLSWRSHTTTIYHTTSPRLMWRTDTIATLTSTSNHND